MLHLIFQSSVDDSILQRIDSGDDVVFHENAVFRVYKGSQLTAELRKMHDNGVYFYVLSDELESRGVAIDELVLGVNVIDYSGLVELTEKNKVILTWR
jgi:tRNA 2-thiouridine synthesizing protein B